MKNEFSKEYLVDLYYNQNLTTWEMAPILGVSQTWVRKLLKDHGIQPKPPYKKNLKGKKLSEEHKTNIRNALKTSVEFSISQKQRGENRKIGKMICCQECNVKFYRKRCKLKLKNKFCSKICFHKWQKKNSLKGENHPCWKPVKAPRVVNPNYKYPRVLTNCLYCQKETSVIKSEFGKAKYGHFCSRKCFSDWRSQNLSGNKNYNYKGGYKDHFYGPSWPYAKRKARERDNNTCQKCGITKEQEGKNLSVHHIIPFRYFLDDNKRPDTFHKIGNSLKNLVCLCNSNGCHGKQEKEDYLKFQSFIQLCSEIINFD